LKAERPRLRRALDGIRHAFALQGPHGPLTEPDRELLARLAGRIVGRGMAMPALLFLRSIRPVNLIGSQAMMFLRPFLTPFFNQADYDRVVAILERREGIGALVDAIQATQAAGEGQTR